MLALLPKVALVVCFLLFLFVAIRVIFFYRKEDVQSFSELPLNDDKK